MGTILIILDPTMIRFIYSAILVILNGYLVFSQNIEGVVVDSITQEPIPYVHIYSEEFQIATISNEEGKFIFKRNEKNSEITFSHISYKTHKIISRNSESLLRVSLLPNKTTLSEVVISDAAYKIAKKVFDKLRNNHSIQFGNAFYRQTTRSGDKPIEFIETFSHISSSLSGIEKFDMYQSRFAKLKSEPDDPYLSFNNFSYLTFGFKIISQIDKDIAKPFSSTHFEDFSYSVKSYFEKDGLRYALIDYEPDSNLNKPSFFGSFTVNLETNSIINFVANTRSSLGVDTITFKKDGKIVKEINAVNHNFKWILNFTDLNGEVWLEYIGVTGTFDWMKNEKWEKTQLNSTLIVFEKDKKRKRNLKESDINQNDIGTVKKMKYNRKFWKDNPIVKRTFSEENIILSFEKTNSFGSYFDK